MTNAEQAVKLITQQQGGTVTTPLGQRHRGRGGLRSTCAASAHSRTLVLLNGKRVTANLRGRLRGPEHPADRRDRPGRCCRTAPRRSTARTRSRA